MTVSIVLLTLFIILPTTVLCQDFVDPDNNRLPFAYNQYGQIVFTNKQPRHPGAESVTPVHGLAVFKDGSGLRTGTVNGSISLFQANYPGQQTVVDISLFFPPSAVSRRYEISILESGDLSFDNCVNGRRWYRMHNFALSANSERHVSFFKVPDVSVHDEVNGVLGRAIRIECVDCQDDSDRIQGCSVIGRVDDEVYVKKPPVFGATSIMIVRDLAPRFDATPPSPLELLLPIEQRRRPVVAHAVSTNFQDPIPLRKKK